MTCRLAGELVSCDLLRYRELNFGQPVSGMQTIPYELAVPVLDYVAAMEGEYDEYAEDDRLYGEAFVEEPERSLRVLGWPPLSQLARQHPLLFEAFVRECQAFDSLHKLLPSAKPPVQPRYIINSIDSVKLEGDLLLMAGSALKRDR